MSPSLPLALGFGDTWLWGHLWGHGAVASLLLCQGEWSGLVLGAARGGVQQEQFQLLGKML